MELGALDDQNNKPFNPFHVINGTTTETVPVRPCATTRDWMNVKDDATEMCVPAQYQQLVWDSRKHSD